MTVDQILAYLRGERVQVPVPPAVPLCQACGTHEAEVGELEPMVCRACLYRLASVAAYPTRFENHVLADLWRAHAEVVSFGQVVVDSHLVGIPPFARVCQHLAPGWVWTDTWPTGDIPLADPGVASLEPRPDGTWTAGAG